MLRLSKKYQNLFTNMSRFLMMLRQMFLFKEISKEKQSKKQLLRDLLRKLSKFQSNKSSKFQLKKLLKSQQRIKFMLKGHMKKSLRDLMMLLEKAIESMNMFWILMKKTLNSTKAKGHQFQILLCIMNIEIRLSRNLFIKIRLSSKKLRFLNIRPLKFHLTKLLRTMFRDRLREKYLLRK